MDSCVSRYLYWLCVLSEFTLATHLVPYHCALSLACHRDDVLREHHSWLSWQMHKLLKREVVDVYLRVAVWLCIRVKSIADAHSEVAKFWQVWEQIVRCEYRSVGEKFSADKGVAE